MSRRRTKGKSNPKHRHSVEQQDQMRVWVIAGLTNLEIKQRCKRRGWPVPVGSTGPLQRYREQEDFDMTAVRRMEVDKALSEGLALRKDRISALKTQAERLLDLVITHLAVERKRWAGPAQNGNWQTDLVINTDLSREYRQTLRQIAEEMGDVTPDFLVRSLLTQLPSDIRNAVIQLATQHDESDAEAGASEDVCS